MQNLFRARLSSAFSIQLDLGPAEGEKFWGVSGSIRQGLLNPCTRSIKAGEVSI